MSKASQSRALSVQKDKVLYDEWHESFLNGIDVDVDLPNLYRNESDLIVVFGCSDYQQRRWCKLEWRAIRELIATPDARNIMLFGFDDTTLEGLRAGDWVSPVRGRSPDQIASLILRRLTGASQQDD